MEKCGTTTETANLEEAVCDNRGGTHISMCHFRNTKCIYEKIHTDSKLNIAYRGKCCEECPNLKNSDELRNFVCDQHGFVYINKCDFDKSACELKRK